MTDTPPPNDDFPVSVQPIEIQQEMEQSFLEYAMSVITARAYPMPEMVSNQFIVGFFGQCFQLGYDDRPTHRKCATVVGDVMSNYHPHGDSAIYEAMVRMGQSFSLANTLIDPHGNFGSLATHQLPTDIQSVAYGSCNADGGKYR